MEGQGQWRERGGRRDRREASLFSPKRIKEESSNPRPTKSLCKNTTTKKMPYYSLTSHFIEAVAQKGE